MLKALNRKISLKRILKVKILQYQDYVNINDLTSRVLLSL